MGLKLSNTASTPNFISWAENPPFDMQSTCAFRIIINLNAAPAANNRVFCKNSSASTVQSYGHFFSSGQLNAVWYEGGSSVSAGTTAGTVLSQNEWYDILWVFDDSKGAGEKLKVYLNGSLYLDWNSVTGPPDTTTTLFAIGKDQRTGNNGAPIDVAEFETYEGPVSLAQAGELYNGGVFKRFQDISLVPSHYYPMLGNETTTITDQVGALNGTGSGVTDAGRHPDMWYLNPGDDGDGDGFRGRSRLSLRGR